MPSPAGVLFPILDLSANVEGDFGSERLAVTGCSDQLDLEPVVRVLSVVIKKLRAGFVELAIRVAIGDKKIEKAICIVVSPGSAAASGKHRSIVNSHLACDISERAI